MNPYPTCEVGITDYRYLTPLHLMRGVNAPKSRKGRDAVYILSKDFSVEWADEAQNRHIITAPKGMVTDLTSSPVHSVVSPTGPWLEAAIIHDYLYVAWEAIDGYEPTKRDRKFADKMLLKGCEAANVGWIKRRIIWAAVRAGGWKPFYEKDGVSFLNEDQFNAILDVTHEAKFGDGPVPDFLLKQQS